VLGHGRLGDHQGAGDRGVRAALGHQRQHLALARREPAQRVAAAGQQLPDHLRVDHGPALGHPDQRADELGAAQRRREVGLLRAVGATPGQVRRLMYAETLVVAVAAGLAGVPLGALTAPLLAGPLIDTGLEPGVFTVTAQPLVWAASFALGLVVALAGVWSSARRSSRVPALDALREAAVERRAMTAARWALGLLGTAAGVALLAALPAMPVDARSTAGLAAAMLLLTASALLAPVAIVPLVRALTWPWRTAATGMLLREGTLTGVRRVASTAAPVLLTVGFTVLLTGTVATIGAVTGPSEAAKIPAAMVAAPLGTPGL
jgi:putative ABC transport system permease protein